MKKISRDDAAKIALSVSEVSERSGLSKSFLRLEIRRKNLPARKIGRRVLILADDLRSYLENAPVV